MRTHHPLEIAALETRCAELESKLAFSMSVASVLASATSRLSNPEAFALLIDRAAAETDDSEHKEAAAMAARLVRTAAAHRSTPIAEA